MKATHIRLLALAFGIIFFDFLFYKQAPGLNALILAPVVLVLIILSGRKPILTVRLVVSAGGMILAGVSVAMYGSFISVLAYFGSFGVLLGFSLEPELRSIFSVLVQAAFNYFTAPFTLISESFEMLRLKKHLPWLWKSLKITIIPIILLFIFTTLFRFANPLFNQLFHTLDTLMKQFLHWLEQYLSIGHIIFLFFTSILIIGILYNGRNSYGKRLEADRQDDLVRKRKKRWNPSHFKATALKDEYHMGILVFTTLNFLLLVVNITEVFWLNGEYRNNSAPAMSQNLHEGTGLLILSILLSMIVMLVLFRKNLNFYSKNKWLVRGSIAWIIQNGILGINVALRNWFYISQYGLTYKRIGVFFFLALVLIGLVFLFIKIGKRKTNWFLIRQNAWSFYYAFLLLSIINWDALIISYNLRANAPVIDISNLLDLPGNSLKLLDEHRANLYRADPGQENLIKDKLDKRIEYFLERQKNLEWQSKNYEDWRTYQYFNQKQ
jgi:hypothetical protein